jgi:hypothetical protein
MKYPTSRATKNLLRPESISQKKDALARLTNNCEEGITTQDPIVDGIVQGLHEIRQGQSVKMTAMDIFNEE